MELVPDSKVVQVVEFESDDPSKLPSGIRSEDNETGRRMSLDKLAGLVE